MRNEHIQPGNFRFDETKCFAENCEAFLATLEVSDAAMALLLRENWGALVSIVRGGERDSNARNEFNAAIATALDAPVAPDTQNEGA